MDNYSKILRQAYESFLLPIGGKKVPTPYRINTPFQPDRKKYGKSNAEELVRDTIQEANKQNFDLEKSSAEEIRKFMGKNQLGIDCSGFAYHLLDSLLKKIGKGNLESNGFSKASSTNVATLTSDQFTVPVELKNAKPGDLIRINSKQADHILIIIETNNSITYVHSSGITNPTGIHSGKIKNGKFPEDLKVFSYNANAGDGIRRLKILK